VLASLASQLVSQHVAYTCGLVSARREWVAHNAAAGIVRCGRVDRLPDNPSPVTAHKPHYALNRDAVYFIITGGVT
jgi:hypothetical protein